MPEENKHREVPYRPEEGTFHSALNVVADKWLHHITASLGASHGLVLLTIERLVIGFGYRVRRVKVTTIAKKAGIKRERVYEILSDLEASGVIFLRDRSRGRPPLIGLDLDWKPTEESLAAGENVKRMRIEKKKPNEVENEVSPVEDTSEARERVLHRLQLDPKNVSSTEDTKLSPTEDTKIHIDKKGSSRARGFSSDSDSANGETFGGFEKKERNPTPPSSSSGKEKNDDDEKIKNYSQNSQKDEESILGEDNDIRVHGEAPGERTAPKESVKDLADDIDSLPSERITDEARELAEALVEEVPRIKEKAARLAQKCIESSSVESLGRAVARCENKLKGREVANAYMYLLRSIYPLEGRDDAADRKSPRQRFKEACGGAKGRPSLNGWAAKVQEYGNSNRPYVPAADRFEKL